MAAANPLRGFSAYAAHIASAIRQLPGPLLLIRHSCGGAVITNAAAQTDNVVGPVYVAAIIPDERESPREFTGQVTESSTLRPAQYPTGDGGAGHRALY